MIHSHHTLVHAFTAAGVLPSQYKRMSAFAEMGAVGKNYIDKCLPLLIVHMCTMEVRVHVHVHVNLPTIVIGNSLNSL